MKRNVYREAITGRIEAERQRDELLAVLETWLQEWKKFKAIFLTSPSMCAIAEAIEEAIEEGSKDE